MGWLSNQAAVRDNPATQGDSGPAAPKNPALRFSALAITQKWKRQNPDQVKHYTTWGKDLKSA